VFHAAYSRSQQRCDCECLDGYISRGRSSFSQSAISINKILCWPGPPARQLHADMSGNEPGSATTGERTISPRQTTASELNGPNRSWRGLPNRAPTVEVNLVAQSSPERFTLGGRDTARNNICACMSTRSECHEPGAESRQFLRTTNVPLSVALRHRRRRGTKFPKPLSQTQTANGPVDEEFK